MSLGGLLRAHRRKIFDSWRERIIGTYSRDGTRPVSRVKDRFSNPIGAVVTETAGGVLDALERDAGRKSIEAALDPLIRMRAVQEFSPSEALGFVFDLRTVVREAAGGAEAQELRDLDRRVDEVALIAFGLYVVCREKAGELKVQMMRDRSYMLMKRAGMLWEEAGGDTEVAGPKRGDAL